MSRIEAFSAVLFDLDGTLIDSEPAHVAANHRLFSECNLPVPAWEHDGFKGRPAFAVFAEMCSRYGPGRLDVDEMVRRKQVLFREEAEVVTLLPGAHALLERLEARGVPTALVTSTDRVLVDELLARLGLHFAATITADDITRPKPDAEPYCRGAEALGVSAGQCLAVEDAPSGIASARAAGCHVVALPTSFPESVLREAGADRVFASLSALQTWLFGG